MFVQAAPVVAGTAALVRQYFEEGWYPTGRPDQGSVMSPTSSLVKAVLINGGRPLVGIQHLNLTTSESAEYDVHQAFGGVSLIHSLPLAGKNRLGAKIVDRQPMKNGEEDTYDITIDGYSRCMAPLSATLVWTDPAGMAGCTICVLNDLDMYVTKNGDSTTYYPNGRTSRDSINNAERIRIDNVQDGDEYVVHVSGTNLESTSQNYSLVITGCFEQMIFNPMVEASTEGTAPKNTTDEGESVYKSSDNVKTSCMHFVTHNCVASDPSLYRRDRNLYSGRKRRNGIL